MRIEACTVSVGQSGTAIVMNPGAVWRASLEHALMNCLLQASPGAQTVPTKADWAVDLALRPGTSSDVALQLGEASERQPQEDCTDRRASFDHEAMTPSDGRVAHDLRRDHATHTVVSLARPQWGASIPVTTAARIERQAAGLAGPPAYGPASTSQSAPSAQRVLRAQGSVIPLAPPTQAPTFDGHPVGIGVIERRPAASAIAESPLPAANCRNSHLSGPAYASRLMQVAEDRDGVRVNLRDARLSSGQMEAIAQTLFWRIDTPSTFIAEIYLNGRRFVRSEPGVADVRRPSSTLDHLLQQED